MTTNLPGNPFADDGLLVGAIAFESRTSNLLAFLDSDHPGLRVSPLEDQAVAYQVRERLGLDTPDESPAYWPSSYLTTPDLDALKEDEAEHGDQLEHAMQERTIRRLQTGLTNAHNETVALRKERDRLLDKVRTVGKERAKYGVELVTLRGNIRELIEKYAWPAERLVKSDRDAGLIEAYDAIHDDLRDLLDGGDQA